MGKIKFILAILFLSGIVSCSENCGQMPNPVKEVSGLGLIPEPYIAELKPGFCALNEKFQIIAEDSVSALAVSYLENELQNKYNLIRTEDVAGEKGTPFHFEPAGNQESVNSEGYLLYADCSGINIKAIDEEGFFYAVQTIIQLIRKNEKGELIIPAVNIHDQPEFRWRGLHLDVCRHFFDTSFIKKYIDLLARHKMNVFHWHLTEDQGWRIEIKKYPLLTKIGSVRKETMIAKNFDPYKGDSTEVNGFYTQQEIREIVEYAEKRCVTIVPEIEMPGHSLAALSAYPQLSCNGGPFQVATWWGVFDDVYCAGNDSTIIFLKDILSEVMELFPSEYIHIGGNECPKNRWHNCEKCQSRMTTLELKSEEELQSWFIKQIDSFVESKGRHIIGWDEILEGGLADGAAVMSWRGESGGIHAAGLGHNVVMSPSKPCYFDHYQSENTDSEPLAIGGLNTLEDVFVYNPIPEELSEEKRNFILGAQANVWSEYLPTSAHVEYMAYPRACALSEVLWRNNPERNYDDFSFRMNIHKDRLKDLNVNFRDENAAE